MAIVKCLSIIRSLTGNFGTTEFHTVNGKISARRRKHSFYEKHRQAVKPKSPPCLNHKIADLMYQGFSDERKKVWRDAVKAPGKSAYDLWMKECLTCWNSGRNAPDTPSVSGGYSTSKVLCDGDTPPPTYEEH